MTSQSVALQRFFLSPYFLLIAALLSFFLGLGSVPLFDLDEGAFTEATREMFESGVFSATYLDGEPRYDKPILFYWFQAASIKLFGFNEWAFRLPSFIAACLWAWAIFSFTREQFNFQRAQIAAAFMLSCLWVALIARSAIADALLNLFLSLTLFDIWRHIKTGKESAILRVYIWMALGTLTKGPVAVVVPVAVSFLYLLSTLEIKTKYLAYFNFKGWLLYFGIITPWLVAVWFTQGAGFFEGFLGDHNLNRFTSTKENHGGSVFYYFGALPLILLPLSGLLIPTFRRASFLWQSPLQRFLLIWFVVIFAIFSFSKTQLPHYILNCSVPIFILLACTPKLRKANRWTVALPALVTLIFVFLPEILAQAAADSDGYNGAMLSLYKESIPEHYRIYAILAFVGVIIASILPNLKTWQRLAISGVILNILVFTQIVVAASHLQQKPIHKSIAFLEANYPGEQVVAYKMHMPSFSVYRKRITPLRTPTNGELAIVRVDRLQKLINEIAPTPVHELYRYGGLVIVRAGSEHE